MTTKSEILRIRGFSEYDIDTNLKFYNSDWNIKSISKQQVMVAESAHDLMPLFYKDSVENASICATHIGRSFDEFADDYEAFDVAPTSLDPYIARLCRAVNDIGAKTCMSCDGWHNSDEIYPSMKLYMKDRYSVIWFWLITEYIFGESWCHGDESKTNWINKWEIFDFEPSVAGNCPRDMLECRYERRDIKKAAEVFDKNNSYAEFLEKYVAEFIALRRNMINTIYERMESKIITDIDNVNFMKARRYMYNAFSIHADSLIDAFAKEYPHILKINEKI